MKRSDLRGLDAVIGMTKVFKAPPSGGGGKKISPPYGGGSGSSSTNKSHDGGSSSTKKSASSAPPSAKLLSAIAHAQKQINKIKAVASKAKNPKVVSNLNKLARSLSTQATKIQQKANARSHKVLGYVGDDNSGGDNQTAATLDSVTMLTDIATTAYALWDQVVAASIQLQNSGQTALAQAAQKPALMCETVGDTINQFLNLYNSGTNSMSPDSLLSTVQDTSGPWSWPNAQSLGQQYLAQAQSAGSTVTDDSGYIMKLQNLVKHLTPQVQQLQSSGQIDLAAQGQDIIDRANSIITGWQNVQQGVPGSTAHQRGAM